MRTLIMKMNRKWKRLPVLVLFIALFILFAIRVNEVEKVELISRQGQTFERGVVTKVLQDNLEADGSRVGEQVVMVKMLTGVKKGREIQTTSSAGYLFGAPCEVGTRVIVMQSVAGESVITSVYSPDREWVIYLFAGIYLAALCLIGGRKGVRGAAALVFTVFVLIAIELPLLYRGYSPVMVSVAVCALTTLVTMYFIGGFTKKTMIATAGTLAGVVTAALFAKAYSVCTGISGWNVSDIESLLTLWETNGIQVGQLLFSGLLISSLGATMDVAMSVASAMQEIRTADPDITRSGLWKAGFRLGRDMMGTDSNTLILAFAGGSLSTLLLDYSYDLPWRQIINSNNIGISLMEGLAGSFGVVMAVPFTVTLAAFVSGRSRRKVISPSEAKRKVTRLFPRGIA